MSRYKYLNYDSHSEGRVVRITMNRPQARNAQNRGLLVELEDAFSAAESDDEVRVVILAGAGTTFSAGHDLGSPEALLEFQSDDKHPSYLINGGTRSGAEARMLQEWHHYFENTKRWRNLRKITIAEAHGPILAGGLMLIWCCDLIVAADDTIFADVVGTRLGMCGTEYFAHPWEFGARKAKELLLTGDALDAEEAHRLGMVSKVFARETLEAQTLAFADRIAALPTMTALLIKEGVNQTLDNMGFQNALAAAFSLHQINHAHWAEINGGLPLAGPQDGVADWRTASPVRLAVKDQVMA